MLLIDCHLTAWLILQRYGSHWKESEAEKNLLRTHTTAVSSRMLYKLAQEGFRPAKYFSIDRVFRNEAIDRTHLAEFHQIEGAPCCTVQGCRLGRGVCSLGANLSHTACLRHAGASSLDVLIACQVEIGAVASSTTPIRLCQGNHALGVCVWFCMQTTMLTTHHTLVWPCRFHQTNCTTHKGPHISVYCAQSNRFTGGAEQASR